MTSKPVLARLEIPESALLLYENMTVKDPDRTGNWRFFLRQDGCFFNARNTQLWITDSAEFKSDAPALFWNTPFSSNPDRCLTEPQQTELLKAISQANFASLETYYSASPGQQGSAPFVERWTIKQGDEVDTVIVENGAAPAQLMKLRTTIDRLIANAPKS